MATAATGATAATAAMATTEMPDLRNHLPGRCPGVWGLGFRVKGLVF